MSKFIPKTFIWIYLILCIGVLNINAQSTAAFEVNFDDCSATDISAGHNGMIEGQVECVCGVALNALHLDGLDDRVVFPASLNSLLGSDFSLSFYVQILNGSDEPVDLFSHRSSCERDSSFALRYIPVTNQISVEFAETVSRIEEITGMLNNPACWNYILITKANNLIMLYINGELVDQELLAAPITLKTDNLLTISGGPCIGFTDVGLNGRIDELKIFSGVLTERQITDLDLSPDKIISNDTTIITGSSVQIHTGGTCADNFSWSPSDGLSSPLDLNPVANPLVSTKYSFTVNDGICVSRDSIQINVVEENEIGCEDLLLPNAFTPNLDGVNDKFGISNLFLVNQVITFKIYDKWGSLLFETNDKADSWDGTFRGESVNPGTLIYKIRYTCGNSEFFKSGAFVLIR